jgi:hypothetical protein
VNRYGELCVRSISQGYPTGGIVFGIVQWNDYSVCDSVDGCPMFQGVRGVRVDLRAWTCPPPPSLRERITRGLMSIWSRAFTDEMRARHDLMKRRQERLTAELVTLGEGIERQIGSTSWTTKARVEREVNCLTEKLRISERRQVARTLLLVCMSLLLICLSSWTPLRQTADKLLTVGQQSLSRDSFSFAMRFVN